MQNKKPKVLFAMVEAGMGHIAPLSGAHEVFERKYGKYCEIEKYPVFTESKYESVRKMGEEQSSHVKKLLKSKNYNRFEAFSYKLPSKLVLKVLDMHFGKGRKEFLKELAEKQPDLVFSTYYLPTHLARQANDKKLTNCLVATYTPDPFIYPAWDRKCDMYLVNNSRAKELAIKKGFKKEVVKQIPFIFKKGVTDVNLSKQQAREGLGLQKDNYTILFTSGAYGAQDMVSYVKPFLKYDKPINFVIVCGKSQELFNQMESLREIKNDCVNYYVIGFTDRLAEYMRAANVMIGKSGMNTIMEAIYHDCPVIANTFANKLEEKILEYFIDEKVALYETDAQKIADVVLKDISGEGVFKNFEESCKKFKVNDGPEQAADLLFELLKTRFPHLGEKE